MPSETRLHNSTVTGLNVIDYRQAEVGVCISKDQSSVLGEFKSVLDPTQPSIQYSYSLGVKLPGCEAYHSSPASSAEVKNVWNYTSGPYFVFLV